MTFSTGNPLLIFGSQGALGMALLREAYKRGWSAKGVNRIDVDMTDMQAISAFMDTQNPTAIVNATAYTDVDGAESPEGWVKAVAINGEAPRVLAQLAHAKQIPFVQVSSDYVFSGEEKTAHDEDSQEMLPINAYGRSKRIGEEAVLAAGGQNYVVRTSRLFGPRGTSSTAKKSFGDVAIGLAIHKSMVTLVDDEYGCPTFTEDLAWGIAELLEKKYVGGIYHLINEGGAISWRGFAEEIYAQLGIAPKVEGVSGAVFAQKRKARVPKTIHLENTRGPKLPSRTEAIARCYRGACPVLTGFSGLTLLQTTSFSDERGSFREVLTQRTLESFGLIERGQSFIQINESVSKQGVLRGLHFQSPPFGQVKLVECVEGVVRDAVVDMRKGSATYGKAYWVDLEAGDGKALWVPTGFAHGFISKRDGSKVRYTVWGAPWTKEAEGGIHPLDTALNIPWEEAHPLLHARDASWSALAQTPSPFFE